MTSSFRIELLASNHNRLEFSCGMEALDRYLREQASQDMRRRASSCYVAIDNITNALVGYYTLSASGTPLAELAENLVKKLPRYPTVPVALLGRLAVDKKFHGKNFGTALLGNAIKRALNSEIAVAAIVVTAKDKQAEDFYLHHNFIKFGSLPYHLILNLSGYKKCP